MMSKNILTSVATLVFLSFVLTLSGCSDSVQSHMDKAANYRKEGKLHAAAIELKNVIQKEPRNGQAREALGEVALARGKYASAVEQLQRARKLGASEKKGEYPLPKALIGKQQYKKALAILHPDKAPDAEARATVKILRGQAYFGLKENQKAAHAFDAVLSAHPENIHALLGRTRIAEANGHYASAKKILNRVPPDQADNSEVWMEKGKVAYNQRKFTKATEAFQKTLALDGKPTPLTRQERFLARFHLTDAQLKNGQFDKAKSNVELMSKAVPGNPYVSYLEALLAYRSGDYRQTVVKLQVALNSKPNSKRVLRLLGAVKAKQGNFAQAETYLQKALAQSPQDPNTLEMLAKLHLQQKHPRQAIQALRTALTNHASNPHLLALLGEAYMQAGNREKAVTYLKQSASHATGDDGMQVSLAHAMTRAGDSKAALILLDAKSFKDHEHTGIRAEKVRIEALLGSRKNAQAIAEAKGYARKHPQDAQAQKLLGITYVAGGRGSDAKAAFQRALKIKPNDRGAEIYLGLIALQGNHPDTAARHFDAVLSQHPKDLTAMAGLVRSAGMKGDRQHMIKLLEKAHKSHPDNTGVQVALVRQYLKQHATDKALPIAKSLTQKHPENASVWRLNGFVQLAAGKKQKALESMQKAAKLAPKKPVYQLNRAQAELSNRQINQAMKHLQALRKKHPDYMPAARVLALVELQQGHADTALETARSLRSQHAAASYRLEGDLLRKQGKAGDAAAAYAKAYQAHPKRALAIRVFVLRRHAGQSHPEKLLKNWIKKHPDDSRALVVLAGWYGSKGKYDAASGLYRKVLARDDKNFTALNNLAVLYQKHGDQRALKLARKAHKLAPENPNAADTLGWLLVRSDKTDAGLPLLRKASKGAPHAPDIQYHLAYALAQTDDKQDARQILDKLLASDQSFESRTQARKLSRKLGQ